LPCEGTIAAYIGHSRAGQCLDYAREFDMKGLVCSINF
jgi:hypothetical protein